MNRAKISYVKNFDSEGCMYHTRVALSRDTMENFLKEVYSMLDSLNQTVSSNRTISYDTMYRQTYLEADIERYLSQIDKNTMHLRLTTSNILDKFLNENNLNLYNKRFIGNVYITVA